MTEDDTPPGLRNFLTLISKILPNQPFQKHSHPKIHTCNEPCDLTVTSLTDALLIRTARLSKQATVRQMSFT